MNGWDYLMTFDYYIEYYKPTKIPCYCIKYNNLEFSFILDVSLSLLPELKICEKIFKNKENNYIKKDYEKSENYIKIIHNYLNDIIIIINEEEIYINKTGRLFYFLEYINTNAYFWLTDILKKSHKPKNVIKFFNMYIDNEVLFEIYKLKNLDQIEDFIDILQCTSDNTILFNCLCLNIHIPITDEAIQDLAAIKEILIALKIYKDLKIS